MRLMTRQKLGVALLAVVLSLSAVGCKKKTPIAAVPPPPPPPTNNTPPPPPPASRPTVVRFDAEPSNIEAGQSVTLRWEVTGADSVAIAPGVGRVQNTGSAPVRPNATTTYVLTATGASGSSASASVTVTVSSGTPPPPTDTGNSRGTFTEQLARDVQDIFFDYDQYAVRADDQATLTRDAEALKRILSSFPTQSVIIEGHCDDRGSAEYNLGLGDRRAGAVRDALVQLGVPGDRLRTISYGKEKPQCTEATEACYATNRRAHFAAGQ